MIVKLKVGDIEMDSRSGISFDNGPASSVPASPTPADKGSGVPLIQRLPNWSRRTYMVLAVLALSATVASIVGALALAGGGSAFWLLPAIPVPGLLFATGLCAWRAATGIDTPDEVDALGQQRSDRLVEHLRGRQSPASVESLINEMGWSEEAVVHGLDAGVRREIIEEDLDVETGHWRYEVARGDVQPANEMRKALPIEDRARQLEEEQTE